MICGVKWKGCDCPWFNYQAVERDRVVHAQGFPAEAGGRQNADHARAARGYQAELDARREQERRDEAFARQLQGMGIGGSPGAGIGAGVEIYQIFDDDDDDAGDHIFQRIPVPPALNFAHHRPPPPPDLSACQPFVTPQPSVLRRHSNASRAYNRNLSGARAAERVVPARQERGYEREREIFAPAGRGGVERMGERPAMMAGARNELHNNNLFSAEQQHQPRGSALAGLTRGGTAEGRVEEWRRWVEVG